jgi:hypothetical protein
MIALAFAAAAVFTWHDADGRLELRDNGAPVLAYNYAMRLENGAPEIKRRSGYIHPVWAPNGAVVTDDFPRDHWHHRGIFWAWPVVRHEGKKYDVWTLTGGPQSRFIKWLEKKDGATARLASENGWFLGDRQILREVVRFDVEPAANNSRRMRFELTFEAVGGPLEIAGSPDANKGYGGFSVRFAPRTNTVVRTDKGVEPKDTDMVPHPWAELEAIYAGKRARLRIDDDASNPGFPVGWCLREYGFLGANHPGLTPLTLVPGKPLTLRYTVTVAGE